MHPGPNPDNAEPEIALEKWDNDATFRALSPAHRDRWLDALRAAVSAPDGEHWADWAYEDRAEIIAAYLTRFSETPLDTLATATGLVRDIRPQASDNDESLRRKNLTAQEWTLYLNAIRDFLGEPNPDPQLPPPTTWLRANPDLLSRFIAVHGDPDDIVQAAGSSAEPANSPKPVEQMTTDELVRRLKDRCGCELPKDEHDLIAMRPDALEKLMAALLRFQSYPQCKEALDKILGGGQGSRTEYDSLRRRFRQWEAASPTRTGPGFGILTRDTDGKLAEYLDDETRHNLSATSREMHARFSDHDFAPTAVDDSLWKVLGVNPNGRPFTAEDFAQAKPLERTKLLANLASLLLGKDGPPTVEWLSREENRHLKTMLNRYQRTRNVGHQNGLAMPDGSTRTLAKPGGVTGSRLTNTEREGMRRRVAVSPSYAVELAARSGLTTLAVSHGIHDIANGTHTLSDPDMRKLLIGICSFIAEHTDGGHVFDNRRARDYLRRWISSDDLPNRLLSKRPLLLSRLPR